MKRFNKMHLGLIHEIFKILEIKGKEHIYNTDEKHVREISVLANEIRNEYTKDVRIFISFEKLNPNGIDKLKNQNEEGLFILMDMLNKTPQSIVTYLAEMHSIIEVVEDVPQQYTVVMKCTPQRTNTLYYYFIY